MLFDALIMSTSPTVSTGPGPERWTRPTIKKIPADTV